jgi:hypothetical protein
MLLIYPIYQAGAQTQQTTTEDAAVTAAKNAADAAEAAAKNAAVAAAKTAADAKLAAEAAAKNATDANNAAEAAAKNATDAKNAKNVAAAKTAADAATKNATDAKNSAEEATKHLANVSSIYDKVINSFVYLLPFGILIIAMALLAYIGYGIYNSNFITHLENPAIARGIITFLFTLSTVVIALLIVLGSLLGTNVAELSPRFQQGKEVLTILIGVFGTIVGFYFGQAREVQARGALAVPTLAVPTLGDISPSSAAAGATLPLVKISGQNLGRVRNVKLIKDGSQPILATNVQPAPTEITCQFQIPAGAATGDWDLVADEGEGGGEAKREKAFKVG